MNYIKKAGNFINKSVNNVKNKLENPSSSNNNLVSNEPVPQNLPKGVSLISDLDNNLDDSFEDEKNFN